MIDFSMYDEQQPEILGYKCLTCGKLHYPAPMICSACNTRRDPVTMKRWETFAMEGPVTLLTWTRAWNLPEGYNVKYLLFGIVEFGNGLRASGRLGTDEPEIGMRLNTRVIETDERPGKPVQVFIFE